MYCVFDWCVCESNLLVASFLCPFYGNSITGGEYGVCVCAYVSICMCAYGCLSFVWICVCVCVCACVCARVRACVHIHMSVLCVCVCVCLCVCMHKHAYICPFSWLTLFGSLGIIKVIKHIFFIFRTFFFSGGGGMLCCIGYPCRVAKSDIHFHIILLFS